MKFEEFVFIYEVVRKTSGNDKLPDIWEFVQALYNFLIHQRCQPSLVSAKVMAYERLGTSPHRWNIGAIFPDIIPSKRRGDIIFATRFYRISAEVLCRGGSVAGKASRLGVPRQIVSRMGKEAKPPGPGIPLVVVRQAKVLYYCLHATEMPIQDIADRFTGGSIPALQRLCKECRIPWRAWDGLLGDTPATPPAPVIEPAVSSNEESGSGKVVFKKKKDPNWEKHQERYVVRKALRASAPQLPSDSFRLGYTIPALWEGIRDGERPHADVLNVMLHDTAWGIGAVIAPIFGLRPQEVSILARAWRIPSRRGRPKAPPRLLRIVAS